MWISFGQSKDNQKIELNAHLRERLEAVERNLRSLDLEFSTLYGKVRSALGRIEKRASVIEKSNPEGPPPDAESSSPQDAPLEGLTPKQIALNATILASRRRM